MSAGSEIRVRQRASIEAFVDLHVEVYADHDVLDYGCGDQPYRHVVERHGGRYHPWNRARYPGTPHRVDVGEWSDPLRSPDAPTWDVILCTQMLQYVPRPSVLMEDFHDALRANRGWLVLTFQTNWPEVEPEDLWRFTSTGAVRLAREAGFRVEMVAPIEEVRLEDFVLPLGGGLLARAV